jgi:hypothetical protein
MEFEIVLNGMLWPLIDGEQHSGDGVVFPDEFPIIVGEKHSADVLFVLFSSIDRAKPFLRHWAACNHMTSVSVKFVELDSNIAEHLFAMVRSDPSFQLVVDPSVSEAGSDGAVDKVAKATLSRVVKPRLLS